MRKGFIVYTFLILLSVLLLSCNNTISDEDTTKVKVTELVNYSLNISGIKSLGIAKTTDIDISRSTNSKKWYGVMASYENHSEYSTDGLSPIDFFLTIDSAKTLTQNQLDWEMDKLFVSKDYTFVSFSKPSFSQRPENNAECDENGILGYDKTEYLFNDNRKSFLIDNESGAIFSLEANPISLISGGLFKGTDGLVYTLEKNPDTKKPVFSALYTNKNLIVYDFFSDCYGNNYISTSDLTYYDSETKTTFFQMIWGCTDYYCLLNETQEVIHFKLTGEGAIHNLDRGYMYESIGIINPDGTERSLVASDNYTLRVGYTIGSRIIYRIINGNVTYYWTPNNDYGGKQLEPYFTDCCLYGQIGLFNVDYWSSSFLYASVSFANTESILIYSIADKTLSVRKINMEDGTFETNVLIENCIVDQNSTTVKTVTPKEDITWRIYAEDNEGIISIKYAKKSEYIGSVSKVVILQPLS